MTNKFEIEVRLVEDPKFIERPTKNGGFWRTWELEGVYATDTGDTRYSKLDYIKFEAPSDGLQQGELSKGDLVTITGYLGGNRWYPQGQGQGDYKLIGKNIMNGYKCKAEKKHEPAVAAPVIKDDAGSDIPF